MLVAQSRLITAQRHLSLHTTPVSCHLSLHTGPRYAWEQAIGRYGKKLNEYELKVAMNMDFRWGRTLRLYSLYTHVTLGLYP